MKICILDGHTLNPGDISWKPIEELGDVRVFPRMKPLDVLENAADAEVILTNKVPMGRDMLDMLTHLKYLGVLATGYNVVDVEYAKQLQLPVTNIPGYSRDSVAQAVFAFILKTANEIADYNSSVKDGFWERSEDFSYLRSIPVELAGKRLGIVGYGDIGAKVAVIARAFGMEVLGSTKRDGSISTRLAQDKKNGLAEAVSLEELFSRSDYISLHIPLTEDTSALVSTPLLNRLRPGAVLVNTARGPVVNEADVISALESGRLAWYASDVYQMEPPVTGSALLHHHRSIYTPHIAWASREARLRAVDIAAGNILAWVDGSPINVVNGITRGR